MTDDNVTCSEDDAGALAEWMASRGGVLVWETAEIGGGGPGSWMTPALDAEGMPFGRPTWRAYEKPSVLITSAADVTVRIDEVADMFHVGVRRGHGLSVVVTDGGKRRIDKALRKAGDGSYVKFDYVSHDNAVIMKTVSKITLDEWIKIHGKAPGYGEKLQAHQI